jgi:hypothetical protein
MPRIIPNLHPCQGIRVADSLRSGDIRKLPREVPREVHTCQGIRVADDLC